MFREGEPNLGVILKGLWHPGVPVENLDAAVVDGAKENCICLDILLSSCCSLGDPAPLIQSTNSL